MEKPLKEDPDAPKLCTADPEEKPLVAALEAPEALLTNPADEAADDEVEALEPRAPDEEEKPQGPPDIARVDPLDPYSRTILNPHR